MATETAVPENRTGATVTDPFPGNNIGQPAQSNGPIPGGERYVSYERNSIHTFQQGAKNYGWAPSSRAACELSQPAASILSLLDGRMLTFEEIVQQLAGQLSLEETRQLLVHLEQVGFLRKFDKHCTPISSINLLLTTRCNMDCLYCYGGKGREKGLAGGSYNLKKEQMSPETGYGAVDYLLKTAVSRPSRNPGGINFFGGEPLLNPGTMRAILEYGAGQSRKFGLDLPRFSITTNGTLITDEFIELCKRYTIAVQVSFDGTASAQNTNRPYRRGDGKNSYDVCCEGFQLLRRNGIKFRIRATIGRHNLDILQAIKTFEKLEVPHVHFAIVNADDSSGVTLRAKDIDVLLCEYEKAAEYMLDRIRSSKPYVRCNNITGLVETLQKKNEKSLCCGAGVGLLSVVPDGRLFLCHRFAGEDAFCLGHIHEGIDFRSRRDFIRQMHITSHSVCRECWCRDLCGGGCPYANFLHSQSLQEPSPMECKLQKGLAQIAIHFASCIRRENEDNYWHLVGET